MNIIHALGIGRIGVEFDKQALSGVGNSVLNIAISQANLGHSVKVLGISDTYTSGRKVYKKVEVIAKQRWLFTRFPSFDLSTLFPFLFEVLRQPKIDVLHLHVDLGLIYLPGARIHVLHLHGVPEAVPARYIQLLKRVDAVVCCSDYVRKSFLSLTGFPPEKAFTVHNGALPNEPMSSLNVETRARLGVMSDEIMILYAGSIIKDKGLHVLIEAFYDIKENNPSLKIKLVIAGGCTLWRLPENTRILAEEYEKDMRSQVSSTDIIFLGLVPSESIKNLYQACDLLVLPSIVQEAHPLAMLEAMAAGKPVIASNVGGIPETIVNGHTGVLFQVGDTKELASAINHLSAQPELRKKIGENAKQRAKDFTWAAAGEKLDEIYQMVMANKR